MQMHLGLAATIMLGQCSINLLVSIVGRCWEEKALVDC